MAYHAQASTSYNDNTTTMDPSATASTSVSTSGAPVTRPAKKQRRSKVAEACKFCRRSHMSCDAGRPCGRCIKRDIAHLCRDEPLETLASHNGTPPPPSAAATAAAAASSEGQQQQHTRLGNTLSLDGSTATTVLHPSLTANTNLLGLDALTAHQIHQQHQQQQSPSAVSSQAMSLFSAATAPPVPAHVPAFTTAANQVDSYGVNNSNGNTTSTGANNNAPSLFDNNFNLAMLDLASGQGGMGAGLGLDMTMEPSSEFSGLGLSEFLQSLNDPPYLSDPQNDFAQPSSSGTTKQLLQSTSDVLGDASKVDGNKGDAKATTTSRADTSGAPSRGEGMSAPGSPVNKTERFLLTAADQKDGSRSDRLARVIHAKFEAGLLRPYNHVAGYTRLMKWMADNMSANSRQRTLQTLSEFRPAFRAIASSLTDLDLVFIEEAFERLLLDYDRVFSSMGIPSCLWRRTGEIYKGNKEFAALVGVPIEHLQGGKLAIYELMAEESAVNYWEKYGNIAFDAGQKAVLTSCVLINQSVLSKKRKKLAAAMASANKKNSPSKDATNQSVSTVAAASGAAGTTATTDKADKNDKLKKLIEEAKINCCFSFTIRRDSYAIPSVRSV
ncbi:Transcription factor [Microbotryomycetes sp. JL201]|nr:Transcription factor [Microbotryomycetes sp. JL201]